jgi:alanine racemase
MRIEQPAPRRAACATIDRRALCHNLARVREAAPGSRVIAAVKADGYGHGLLTVAETLDQADGFAVARSEEGIALREAGIDRPVVVLQGVDDAKELAAAVAHDLQLCIHQEHQLALLELSPPSRPLDLWIKIDTGMHRLGFAPERGRAVFEALSGASFLRAAPRLMTHLACADERDGSRTHEQVRLFDAAVAGLEAEQSIANSAGVLAWPETHRDWVRPGIMLYGGSPFINGNAIQDGLEPVMTLTAPLFAINHIHRGEAVGYGATWVCPEDMPVGVAAIGYGDGYPRHASNGAPALVNGQRTRVIGRVSMDMVTLDLRGIDAHVGDEVVLWGKGLPIEEVAAAAGTISYELMCGVGSRVRARVEG